MKAVRLKDKIIVEDGRVMLFPDLSTEVQRQRKLFDRMKQSLRQMCKEYGFLFPAKMWILHNKSWHYFTSPSQAEKCIWKIKKANINYGMQKESLAEMQQVPETFEWK